MEDDGFVEVDKIYDKFEVVMDEEWRDRHNDVRNGEGAIKPERRVF